MEFLSVLIIISIIKKIVPELSFEEFKCDRETPLFNINTNSCVLASFDENKHQISNELIKTQWLNKINQIGIKHNWYMGYDFSTKGDLIILSIKYEGSVVELNRYFYGIKSNGRPFFYEKNSNKFINEISLISATQYKMFEIEFIKINLISNDVNDYYLSTSVSNCSIDIINFNENKISGVPQNLLFNEAKVISLRNSIFELKNAPKTYIFCFIGEYNSNYYLSLQKFQFFKNILSEADSFKKIGNSLYNEQFKVNITKIISCLEITKYSLIQCFYLNITNYIYIGLFDENDLNYKYSEKVDETLINEFEWNLDNNNIIHGYEGYFKNILLKKEISILSYIIPNENIFQLYIKIKEVIYNEKQNKYFFEDYLVRYKTIKLNSQKINIHKNYYYINDIIKINNTKFAIIISDRNTKTVFIIICELYKNVNLFIKYYYIDIILYNFSIYNFLKSIVYNKFLGLTYTIQIGNNGDLRFVYFSLFSYINGTDSLNNNLNNMDNKLILNEYISENNVENNIFGVTLVGIKILKLPSSKDTGVYYISQINNELVFENDILSKNDVISFIFDYENLHISDNIYTIEFAGIVQTQNYSEDIKFSIYYEFYGNESFENFHEQNIYIGRTNFYNFTIKNNIEGTNLKTCCNKCKICYNNKCIKCEDNYKLIFDRNLCQIEFNEEGYYLHNNNGNLIYKKCHEFCKTCNIGPIYSDDFLKIEDTNCIECISDYYKVEGTNNCVYKNTLLKNHYFNEIEKKFLKCSENCLTCNQSQINSTFFGCSSCDEISILYPQSMNCLNCFAKNKYINPYFNSCLDEIPEGHYLLDEDNRLVDTCFPTCKKCDKKGNESNHECLECGNNFIYNYTGVNGEKCLDDCINYDLFKDNDTKRCFDNCLDNIWNNKTFGFNFECYEQCPEGTIELENNICSCQNLYYLDGKKTICINSPSCPDTYPLQKENSSECYKNCDIVYKLKCVNICPNNTFNITIQNLTLFLDILNDDISLDKINLDEFSILNKLDNYNKTQTNIEINYPPYIVINMYPSILNIYETSKQNSNLTFIDLNKCEDDLREFYSLSKDEILYIISAEIPNSISNRVTNEFIFDIYLKNGTKLQDLSVCNNESNYISVLSKISKLDLINFDKAEDLYEQGYNIYNITSEFYTDGCSPAKIGINDIPLKDRKLIFPENISFCPQDCNFLEVIIETKRVKCDCNVYYSETFVNISTNFIKGEAKNNFLVYLLDNFNYKVFKCYHVFLDLNYQELFQNIGFIFGVIAFIINFIFLLIFSFYTLSRIRIELFKNFRNEKNLKEIKNKIENGNINDKTQRKRKEKKRKSKKISSSRNNINNFIFNGNITNSVILIKANTITKSIQNKDSNAFIKGEYKKKLEEDEINYLPYTEALKNDYRNIFLIIFSIFKFKLEIIHIFFYPENFTYRVYSLSMYISELFFEFFTNALLYSDDIVSEKYHNNGKLNILTSIFLSLTSNFISCVISSICLKYFLFNEALDNFIKVIKKEKEFLIVFKKIYKIIKIKSFCFYFLSLLFIIFMSYYLILFCSIYNESQISLLINYIMGIIESLLTNIFFAIIISLLRFIGLKCKNIYFYRASVYLDQKI